MARADAFSWLRDYEAALFDYDEAAKLDPKDTRVFCNMGWALLHLGRKEAALNALSKAIELEGRNGAAFASRATVFKYMKEYEKATKDYARSVELDPKDERCLCQYAWFLAGCPDAKFRDGNRAVELAKKALKLKKSRDALESLAAAYAETANFDEAIRSQKEAINLPITRREPEDAGRRRLELYKKKMPYRFETEDN